MSTPAITADLSQPGAGAQPQPQAPPPTQAPAPGPHSTLLRMIQGLAVGVGAFAHSAATQGRAGGMADVEAFENNQQEQQMRAQQSQQSAQAAQREQSESDLRMKAMNAQLLMNQAAYHHALQMYPTEEKEANLKVLNDATASYKDALAEGYDIADPAQAAMWRQMQQNIISIPFSSGQNQQEVLSAATDAASKNGKHITDYVPIADYNDGKHGTGGNLTLVPASGLQQVQATLRQIATGMAQMKATLDTATTALGKDDPDVKALSGKIDTIQKVLDNGGKPSAYDFIQLGSSVLGPLSTRIAGVTQSAKIAEQKAQALKAQQDADPNYQAQLEGMKTTAREKAELPFVGKKAAATAAAQQPYQVALKQMEAPIAQGVENNKEAREAVQGAYVKPFLDKMQAANELISSLSQAETGNAAASQAAIAKMVGITMPAGAKRVSPDILRQIESQGNIPQQYIGSLKEALTGDRWTSKMTQDMKDFAAAQIDVAKGTLRSGVRATNALHGTKIDPEALIQAAGPLDIQPAGPQAGKWGSLIPSANTLKP
jgi:hypothetical protein